MGSEPYFNLVRVSKSSWIAVPVNRSADGAIYTRAADSALLHNGAPVPGQLFAGTAPVRTGMSERLRRLTIVALALGLLGVSATWLSQTGFLWK